MEKGKQTRMTDSRGKLVVVGQGYVASHLQCALSKLDGMLSASTWTGVA